MGCPAAGRGAQGRNPAKGSSGKSLLASVPLFLSLVRSGGEGSEGAAVPGRVSRVLAPAATYQRARVQLSRRLLPNKHLI